MTATPSHASAQRLPRDLALVTVAIDAAMVLVNMAIQLWPDSPHSDQLRSAYALPGVWIPMVFSIGMAWVLAQAVCVVVLAELQWTGLRRTRGGARMALA
ncbi:hypothetical protein ACSFA3_26030 [Variovorax sp. RHLX14]|uniref:hypothetical protein n=1 Tax=Variovorax sp. RHLX14 TaxID=1259731 RepID=UPI003F44DB9C